MSGLKYDPEKIGAANAIATMAHGNQKRKFTGEPYIMPHAWSRKFS